jgi:hypothetical protein
MHQKLMASRGVMKLKQKINNNKMITFV